MPSFNFLQYQESLLLKEICYCCSVVDFTQMYYVDWVGMMDDAAAEFVHSAKWMLGKQKKEKHQAKKQRVVGKENQPIHVQTSEL